MLSALTERSSYFGYKPGYSGAPRIGNEFETHAPAWATSSYMAALHNMALRHAEWWDVPDEGPAWTRLPAIYESPPYIAIAREALVKIESAHWACALLGEDGPRTFLALIDDPSPVLDLLFAAPHTLVAGDSESPLEDTWAGNREGAVFKGPAAYELAGFHSSARWLRGRTPLSLTESRSYYLEQLTSLLDSPVDRCLFDATFDAAAAWRFAVLWLPRLVEHHATLLAQAHAFRRALVEPSIASLQRLRRL